MNATEIKTFAATNNLTIRALHSNGEFTDRELTHDDAGFAVSVGEGRDREDLGSIWATDGEFVLERPSMGDTYNADVLALLKLLQPIPAASPFDIETAREDEDLPEAVDAMFGDDDAPAHFPHDLLSGEDRAQTLARIAALVTALGGKVGAPDNGFHGLAEEDTLVFDPSDGSLALYVPGRGYAWEVAE